MRANARSMVPFMFGAQQIRKGFSLWALVLGVVFVSVPNYASAESPAINRFVRSYRMAWSAPTPIPLLNLAVHPGVFTELAALDRWDFLDFSDVNVEILRHGRTSGSEITVELLRSQYAFFTHGSWFYEAGRLLTVIKVCNKIDVYA